MIHVKSVISRFIRTGRIGYFRDFNLKLIETA
jgi:hypothetical protein